MTYTDLIFDLYGTLVDIHTEEDDTVWKKTALFFGFHGAAYAASELRDAFHAGLTAREARAGQSYECFPDIPMDAVFADLFRAKGVTERVETLAVQASELFRIASIQYIRLYDGVSAALATLRRRGYRLWLLSNAQAVFTRRELELVGLADQFDGVYLSSDFLCRKPDGRFFAALLEGEGLDKSRCLMIGNDLLTDIGGAKAAGLATLYLHTNLTPGDQPPADPGAPAPHYEQEGTDWAAIAERIMAL